MKRQIDKAMERGGSKAADYILALNDWRKIGLENLKTLFVDYRKSGGKGFFDSFCAGLFEETLKGQTAAKILLQK
jgi:hypothetical protein